MEKYIPYEKLSKKERKKRNAARRGTWGPMDPVTRKPRSSRAYDRRNAQRWKKDLSGAAHLLFACQAPGDERRSSPCRSCAGKQTSRL